MPSQSVVYKLQREGRTVCCDSATAYALLETGWRLVGPAAPRPDDAPAIAFAASVRDLWRRLR